MNLKYDFPVEAGNEKRVYGRIISWAKPGLRALDVGCDTGRLGEGLKRKGLAVDGVEMDPDAARLAAGRLDRVVTGSILDASVLHGLNGPYDIIIFADVLEHLPQPEAALDGIKALLSDEGEVYASLPNVANFRVRLPLLFGRFQYTEIGILDKTHLRFFTRTTARELFTGAGYEVAEVKPAATHLPAPLLYALPGLFATRFVIRARPRKTT